MNPERPRVLLIGPRLTDGDVVGGARVSFERLLADLERRDRLTLTVVDTSRDLKDRGRFQAAWLNFTTFVATLIRLWRHAASAHLVVWNVSARGAVLGGASVWLLCRLRQRPLLVRVFGGGLQSYLASKPAVVRFLASRTFLRADLLLLQTRRLVEEFGARCATVWFPTTRDMPSRRHAYRDTCRRLLFLSQLRPTKGLPELLAAARRFPPAVSLSVFGPPMPGFDPRSIDSAPNVRYGGSVPPAEVPGILEAHDALVLPTRYSGEGYPGAVIEAFQMGLPVVVTPLAPIRELVTEGEDGLFVTAGSVDSIVDAIARITGDERLFRHLREGALRTGEQFRSELAAARLEDLCRRAVPRQDAERAES